MTFISNNRNEVEENHVVGWPPIKSWMKKQLHQQQQQQQHHQGGRVKNDGVAERSGGRNSLYVKVKMEGVAIARKIDLRLFHSYQALTNTLISMFDKGKWENFKSLKTRSSERWVSLVLIWDLTMVQNKNLTKMA